MQNLSYSIKKPEAGDKGAPIFNALTGNIDVYVAHTHNGTNSAPILASSLTKGTVNLSSGSWVATAGGNGYKQTVTCPGAHTLANSDIRIRIRTGGSIHTIIHPTIIPASVTQFDVIVNDASLDLEVMFL